MGWSYVTLGKQLIVSIGMFVLKDRKYHKSSIAVLRGLSMEDAILFSSSIKTVYDVMV